MFNIVSTTSVPSDVLKTGDHFRFDASREDTQRFDSGIEIRAIDVNDTLLREENRGEDSYINASGSLDVTIVRNEGPMDTTLLIESNLMSLTGSQRSGYDYLFDSGPDNQSRDDTYTDDLSGQSFHDRDQFDTTSNATYAIITPELTDDIYYLNFGRNFFGIELSGLPETAPLIYRDVWQEFRNYIINGVAMNLSVTVIKVGYSVSYDNNATILLPFGSAGEIEFNANISLSFDMDTELVYDTISSHLLEIHESTSMFFGLEFGNDLIDLSASEAPSGLMFSTNHESGPGNVSVYGNLTTWLNNNNSNVLVESNAFYGRMRAVSEGTNRLEEGDVLVYAMEGNSSSDIFIDVKVGSDFESRISQQVNIEQQGRFEIDVFRHSPGHFEAVNRLKGTTTGTFSSSEFERQGTSIIRDNSTTGSFLDMFFDVSLFDSNSSAQFEIIPGFDDNLRIGGDGDDCDNGDCGLDLMLPQFMPKTRENQGIFFPDEVVVINGFAYWLEADWHNAVYALDQAYTMNITLGGDNPDEEPLVILADVVVKARGNVSLYYDVRTGVLVAFEEEMRLQVTVTALQDIDFGEPGFPQIEVLNFTLNLVQESRFFILLSDHPNEYLVAQDPADIPTRPIEVTTTAFTSTDVSTSTDATTTSTVEETTSEQTSDTSEEETAAPGLPLPIVPILAAILVPVVIRLRRRS
ncbi:MAG: hypothetical protein IH840_08940 [Candidatus Heimdallarchaeota archaeon]|nr:hypothetical protein [Candidatus Heimdallarchaeota archaeon]